MTKIGKVTFYLGLKKLHFLVQIKFTTILVSYKVYNPSSFLYHDVNNFLGSFFVVAHGVYQVQIPTLTISIQLGMMKSNSFLWKSIDLIKYYITIYVWFSLTLRGGHLISLLLMAVIEKELQLPRLLSCDSDYAEARLNLFAVCVKHQSTADSTFSVDLLIIDSIWLIICWLDYLNCLKIPCIWFSKLLNISCFKISKLVSRY